MAGNGTRGRDELVGGLLATVAQRGGALLGPPGSGLSTVLRTVADELRAGGRQVRLLRCPDDRWDVAVGDDTVLAVDDAHRADPAQLQALRDRALELPVLLAARTGAAGEYLSWLWRSDTVARFELGDLDDDVIARIVEQRAGGQVHRSTLDGIVHRSAGRPGFAVDEIDSLLADGRLREQSGMLRGQLTGQVGSRLVERAADVLGELPASLASMVEVLAMAGRLPVPLLATLDVDLPELERRALVRRVDITAAPAVQPAVRLHPPVLATAVRATIPPARAVERARPLLAAAGSLAPDDRARLLVLTGEHVDLDDLATAARSALRDDQRIEAVHFARLAGERGPRGVAVEADLLADLGARAEAAERYASLMADTSAPDALRAGAAMEHSLILMWDLARADEAVATAAGLAVEAANTVFGPAAKVHLASLTMYAGRPRDAAEIIADVDPAALDAATRPGRVLVDTVARALVEPAEVDDAAVRALIDDDPDGPIERGVFIAAAELTLELQGSYADADTVVDAARTRRQATETPASAAWSALAEARSHLAVGRPGPARRAALESAAVFADVNHRSGLRWASGAALLAAAIAGDRPATRQLLESYTRLDVGVPFLDPDLLRARGWAALVLGDSATAEALLSDAAELAAGSGAVALEAVAVHDSFRLLRSPVRARLGALARRAPVPSIVLRARHVELVAADDAAGLLDLAGDVERTGALLLAAEIAADAARQAADRGLRSLARTAVGHRVRLAALCGDPATPGLTGHRPIRLTTRERDVAMLAAEGHTSRQIAQTLAVSVRTVDNLLQRVYVKLGVHGRAELADALADTGMG